MEYILKITGKHGASLYQFECTYCKSRYWDNEKKLNKVIGYCSKECNVLGMLEIKKTTCYKCNKQINVYVIRKKNVCFECKTEKRRLYTKQYILARSLSPTPHNINSPSSILC